MISWQHKTRTLIHFWWKVVDSEAKKPTQRFLYGLEHRIFFPLRWFFRLRNKWKFVSEYQHYKIHAKGPLNKARLVDLRSLLRREVSLFELIRYSVLNSIFAAIFLKYFCFDIWSWSILPLIFLLVIRCLLATDGIRGWNVAHIGKVVPLLMKFEH